MSFALGRKCYVRNWTVTVTKFCDIGTGDFRFRFSAENGISVSSALTFTAGKMHFRSVFVYIKLFQITSYVNDFDTFNNYGSGRPVDASKN